MNRTKLKKAIIISGALIIMLSAFAVSAKVFVDWRGKFKVEYPDNWHHVPYERVNDFLLLQGIDPDYFEYDAVLAKDSANPFEAGAYLFITLEQVGELTRSQIDSTLRVIAAEYGVSRTSTAPLFSGGVNLTEKVPTYDREGKTVVTKSLINTSHGQKILLDFRKFYDQGLAVFLCYTYEKDYLDTYSDFFDIVKSFSTENLHEADMSDSVKIVDLSERDAVPAEPPDTLVVKVADSEAEDSGFDKKELASIIIPIGALMLIIAIVVMRRKKKR